MKLTSSTPFHRRCFQVLNSASNVSVVELKSGRFWGTQCDVDKPPFDNADLRKALAYGVDRDEIKKCVFGDTGRVGTHPFGTGWAYDASLDSSYYGYDPDMAKQHLDSIWDQRADLSP